MHSQLTFQCHCNYLLSNKDSTKQTFFFIVFWINESNFNTQSIFLTAQYLDDVQTIRTELLTNCEFNNGKHGRQHYDVGCLLRVEMSSALYNLARGTEKLPLWAPPASALSTLLMCW